MTSSVDGSWMHLFELMVMLMIPVVVLLIVRYLNRHDELDEPIADVPSVDAR